MHHLLLAFLLVLVACAANPAPADDRPPAPLQLGSVLAPRAFTTLDGATVQVPDPSGGHVVLELIRSADW